MPSQHEHRKGSVGRASLASPSGARWRCYACGEPFTKWAPAERHGNVAGHHRIEVIL